MKHTKRILSVLLAALLIAVSVPYVCAASLNYTAKSLYYGKSVTLQVSDGKASAWTSSNTAVATVSSKGVVRGVGIGTAVISATVGKQTLTCKVKVKDRNVDAVVVFRSSTGGAFINGVNTAVIKVKPLNYNVGRAVVYITDAADEIVYKTTLTKLAKNKTVSLSWNGRNNKNKLVPNGTYTVNVLIGKTVSKSDPLTFLRKNYFTGGDGSKKNPFQIATPAQLGQIIRYPNASFIQTKDLDFEYEAVGGFFTEDNQFNGVYDGNGKTISCIAGTAALFQYIGTKGQVKDLNVSKSSVNAERSALLCTYNYGKITNCNVSGATANKAKYSGIVVAQNFGLVSNCVTSGSVSVYGDNVHAGGVVGHNEQSGKIVSCESRVNVSIKNPGSRGGGICGENNGLISDCTASGTVIHLESRYGLTGGIAGRNNGTISGCAYLGTSEVNLMGDGSGGIL